VTLTPTRQPEQVESPDPTELLIKEARQRTRRRRLTIGLVVLAVTALALAGSLIAGRQTPAPRGTALTSPATNITTASQCSAAELTTKLGRGSASAGIGYETLEMINHSAAACVPSGTPATRPGVFTSNGQTIVFRPVGPAATPTWFTLAKRGGTVVLRHGAIASVTFGMQTASNYVASQCDAAPVDAVRLIFHRGTSSTTLYYKFLRDAVCTKLSSTETDGVVHGTRWP
jgi:hypothetical protein